MMHVVPKWKVAVRFGLTERDVTVFISDNHIENVLRTIASGNALDQPTEISVSLVNR